MITRKEYMADSTNLHHAYFLQWATPRIRAAVDRLKDRIMDSTDPYLNDIDLSTWDLISRANYHGLCDVNLKINGRVSASLSDGVCAAKAYANELRGLEIWEGRNKR